MPDVVLRFDLDLFKATRVKALSRDVGWDSELTNYAGMGERRIGSHTLTAVGVAVD